MKFLHTMIRVKDIEASMKFYTEVLNMKFDHKKRLDDCWLYFLTDEENTCQIELTVNDETPAKITETFRGVQSDVQAWEELTSYEWYTYKYITTRTRGRGKWTGKVRATLNPKRSHWIFALKISQSTRCPGISSSLPHSR